MDFVNRAVSNMQNFLKEYKNVLVFLSIFSGIAGNNVPELNVYSQQKSCKREKSEGEAGAPRTNTPEMSLNLRQFPR